MLNAKRLLLLLIFLGLSPACWAQTDLVLFWNGFQHDWDTQQLLNKWGDFPQDVRLSDICDFRAVHLAKPGRAAGASDFNAFYQLARVPGVRAYADNLTVDMTGKEGDLLFKELQVLLPERHLHLHQENYVALLQGFEVQAIGRAEKIERLSIEVGDGYHSPADKAVKFDVSVSLQTGSRALCNGELFDNRTAYQIRVYYLVLSGDSALTANAYTLARQYFWDKRPELNYAPQRQLLKGDTTGGDYAAGVPAFKSVSFTFDKPYAFRTWNMALTQTTYHAATHEFVFTPNFFFKQWGARTKGARKDRRKAGVVDIRSRVALLEFRKGCAEALETQGRIKGGNDDDAERYVSGMMKRLECK